MIYLAKAYLGACDGNLLKTEVALKAARAHDARGMDGGRNTEKKRNKEKNCTKDSGARERKIKGARAHSFLIFRILCMAYKSL